MRRLPFVLAMAAAVAAPQGLGAQRPARVRIPAGSYRPLYARAGEPRVPVAAFSIDREPVTRGQFQAFVRANPQWRRGAVGARDAESGYLADWTSPADPGAATLGRPVTDVSWFAASAYCAWRGERLPTTDEWEYVAAASPAQRDATGDPAFVSALLAAYLERAERAAQPVGRGAANVYGVRDLHDLVWEWTADFDGMAMSAGGGSMDMSGGRSSCVGAALGASDPANYAAFLRQAVRDGLTRRSTSHSLGFRCAA